MVGHAAAGGVVRLVDVHAVHWAAPGSSAAADIARRATDGMVEDEDTRSARPVEAGEFTTTETIQSRSRLTHPSRAVRSRDSTLL